MRPHRLVVTAFGPFAGTETVDFDELSAGGPFLLHGPTGAGKTSLLDAMGYALFGDLPGSRGVRELRSHHAPEGLRTRVELWATVGGRAVHVVRTPWQERPRRGGGTTSDNATVSVRVAADLASLAEDECLERWSGVQEANAELADLVGMSAAQFFQVALLPQGQFATFLRAADSERADVLRRLFDIERFTGVEAWLRQRRDEAHAALTSGRAEADRLAALMGALADDEVGGPLPDEDRGRWAETLLRESVDRAARADLEAEAAAADLAAARSRHDRVVERVRLLQERVRLQERSRELADAEPSVTERRRQLAAADRAAEVAPLLELSRSARAAVASAAPALAEALLDVGHDPAEPPQPDDLSRVREAASQRVGALRPMLAQAERAVALRTQADRHRQDVTAAVQELVSVQARAEALPGLLATAESDLADAEDAVVRAAGLDARRDRLDRAAGLAHALVAAHVAHGTAERDELDAEEAARAAEAARDRLRRLRLDGMAAELATALDPGEGCPVCGSTDHPHPAGPAADRVGAEDEDAATERAARLRTTASRAAGRRAACEAEARLLREELARLGHDGTADAAVTAALAADVTSELAAVTAELAAVRAVAHEREPRRELLVSLQHEVSELDRRLAALERARDAATALAATVEEQAASIEADVADAAAGYEDLASAFASAEREVVRLEVAETALRLHEQARRELEDADARARSASLAHGFDGADAAAAAVREQAWRDSTRADVRAHDEQTAAVAARLAETDLAGLPDGEPGDGAGGSALAAAADALAAAVEMRDATEQARRRAETTRTRLGGLLPQLLGAEAAVGRRRVEHEQARELADLASGSGGNSRRMALSTYVLAAHLEQVVAAANVRLDRMSDHRYLLVHDDRTTDRRTRGGLGLAVLDAWTDTTRPAATLSGGETFLASLALALGLADVVTARAGGVHIGALFVDEGFGTLDPDALDKAMDALDGLQEHGRLVGVVSHVADLQHRLPRQLLVQRGNSGSSVHVIGA